MSESTSHMPGLATCQCVQCVLIACGAIDRSWDGWAWGWLAGEGRVALMRLVRQEPMHWVGPRGQWAGCIDRFRVMGEALDFDDEEDDGA
jgi:hypothetical protein